MGFVVFLGGCVVGCMLGIFLTCLLTQGRIDELYDKLSLYEKWNTRLRKELYDTESKKEVANWEHMAEIVMRKREKLD